MDGIKDLRTEWITEKEYPYWKNRELPPHLHICSQLHLSATVVNYW